MILDRQESNNVTVPSLMRQCPPCALGPGPQPWTPSLVHEEIVKQPNRSLGLHHKFTKKLSNKQEIVKAREGESDQLEGLGNLDGKQRGAGKSEERERERTGGAESDLWRSAPSDLVMWVAARLESW